VNLSSESILNAIKHKITETAMFIKISGTIILLLLYIKVKMQYNAPAALAALNLPMLNFSPRILPAANKAKKSMQKFNKKTMSAYITCLMDFSLPPRIFLLVLYSPGSKIYVVLYLNFNKKYIAKI
jgi:hypothetical protein